MSELRQAARSCRPQLERFTELDDLRAVIGARLRHVQRESVRRGYKLDRPKIIEDSFEGSIPVTANQLI